MSTARKDTEKKGAEQGDTKAHLAEAGPSAVTPEAVAALQQSGTKAARLCGRLASDAQFSEAFLAAMIEGNAEALSRLFQESQLDAAETRSVPRPSDEKRSIGVKEASYQVCFDAGQFRLFVGVEEA
jgi:hypothetical protein